MSVRTDPEHWKRGARGRIVTTAKGVPALDAIDGKLAEFVGWAAGYPWVRVLETGETFVWDRLDFARTQMELPL